MTLALESHAEGTILPVRARPKARKNAILGEHAGRLKVSVTQAPEKGKANLVIASLLAESLGLKRSQIELISGETSPQKRFLIRDIDSHALDERLQKFVTDRGSTKK